MQGFPTGSQARVIASGKLPRRQRTCVPAIRPANVSAAAGEGAADAAEDALPPCLNCGHAFDDCVCDVAPLPPSAEDLRDMRGSPHSKRRRICKRRSR
jgi:hypothetical protein